MGSALQDSTMDAGDSSSAEALRFQAAERLAAHRSRRGRVQGAPAGASQGPRTSADGRAARIAAVVAERYAQSQSYCAFLAAEAERAVQQAQAAAEVAALNAQAMLAVQQTLLDTLERGGFSAAAAHPGVDIAELGGTPVIGMVEGPVAGPYGDAGRILEESPGTADAALQRDLLRELNLWPEAEAEPAMAAAMRARTAPAAGRKAGLQKASTNLKTSANPKTSMNPKTSTNIASAGSAAGDPSALVMPVGQSANGGLRVRLYNEAAGVRLPQAAHGSVTGSLAESPAPRGYRQDYCNDAEAQALDEEIAFRQAPVFEEPAGPPMPLPANLIEFPRQLVASRKARPRLAEGPLREDEEAAPGGGQLRIFEVNPAQIDITPSTAPAVTAGGEMTQWTSLWLDAPGHKPATDDAQGRQILGEDALAGVAMAGGRAVALPQVASIGRRVSAAAIDGGLILGGFLVSTTAFSLTACYSALRQPDASAGMALSHALRAIVGQAGSQPGLFLAAGALGLVCLYLLYQVLFFSLAEGTPGMRCARIALCTFDEENPARLARLRRILAVTLCACPLGLGFLWALLDEERLAWHDRVSRIYQRSY